MHALCMRGKGDVYACFVFLESPVHYLCSWICLLVVRRGAGRLLAGLGASCVPVCACVCLCMCHGCACLVGRSSLPNMVRYRTRSRLESTVRCGTRRPCTVAVSGCASWFEDLHKYMYGRDARRSPAAPQFFTKSPTLIPRSAQSSRDRPTVFSGRAAAVT